MEPLEKNQLLIKSNQYSMNEEILLETLKEMNESGDSFYFVQKERKWQPLSVTLSPSIRGYVSVIPFLSSLAITDQEGTINPLISEAGLFASITICNEQIGQFIPIKEILVSDIGLEFLRSINEKRFLKEGGYFG